MEYKNGIVYSSFEDELNRLEEIYSFRLLNPEQEESLDRITRLVADIFQMPVTLISIVTSDRQWFKSYVGLEGELLEQRGSEREASFCQYVVAHKEPLVIQDASVDDRFKDNRLVTGEEEIRFYAGVPLKTEKGSFLGTLCVIDNKPRDFAASDLQRLKDFSNIVMTEIALRQKIRMKDEVIRMIKDSEESYKRLVDLSPETVIVVQKQKIVYINPAGCQIMGIDDPSILTHTPIDALIHPDSLEEATVIINEILEKKTSRNVEWRIMTNKGITQLLEIKATYFSLQGVPSVLAIARDISAQKEAEKKLLEVNEMLVQMSTLDGLTGISNRRRLEEYLELEWNRSKRNITPISLLMLDIDYFKAYNDTFGHLAGDEVLKAVANSVKQTLFRSADLLARFGGEEFAIVLPQTDEQGAGIVAENVLSAVLALQIPHPASLTSPNITVSIGVATLIGNPLMDYRHLIDMADKALYESKTKGRNQMNVFQWRRKDN